MGDVDDGHPEILLQRADLLAHRPAQTGIEVRERLVEQQDIRLEHQRARHRDPLLLAAGHLGRQTRAKPLQADEAEDFLGPGVRFLLVVPPDINP